MNRNRPTDQPAAALEVYLDQLCAHLQQMPQPQQAELREEIRQHLEHLVARQSDPTQVVQGALAQFGDPHQIGVLLARDWEEQQWDLGSLSLSERIRKVREAASSEMLSRTPLERGLDWGQSIFLIVAVVLSPRYMQQLPSWFALHQDQLRLLVYVLYPLVAALAAGVSTREGLRQGRELMTMLRILLARVSVFPLPYLILLPPGATPLKQVLWQITIVSGVAGIAAGLLIRSRQARCVTNARSLYGLLLGVVIVAVNYAIVTWLGGPPGLWGLALNTVVFYCIGRWVWGAAKKSAIEL